MDRHIHSRSLGCWSIPSWPNPPLPLDSTSEQVGTHPLTQLRSQTMDTYPQASEEEFPSHLRISASDLQVGAFIGAGSSSVVRRGNWLGCEVAVKQLRVHDFATFGFHVKELEILTRFPHPHVVQLLGYTITPTIVSIVMECMETSLLNVTISRMLRYSSTSLHRPFAPSEALHIMMKIALGMKFLHSRGVRHGSLTPDIVLMNVPHSPQIEFQEVKIGGFAFSHYATDLPMHPVHGRFEPYWAPEIQTNTSPAPQAVTTAADVYSFAMICYGVLTGCSPLRKEYTDLALTHAEMKLAVAAGLRPALPVDMDHNLADLMRRCWDGNPEQRPDFSEICNTLAELKEVLATDHLQQETTSTLAEEEEDRRALRWTTHKDVEEDQGSTWVEIAKVLLDALPDHLSIDPADVKWRCVIGEGGYNKVYEVNWLGCTFAVKRYKSTLSGSLKDEVGLLIKLQHPHIARLIGVSVEQNGAWVMMERMDMDLRQVIDSRLQAQRKRNPGSTPFRDHEVQELCHKVALGLSFLHSKEVVHRDVKAANVLVHDRGGRFDVKITDFGVSHRIGDPSTVAESAGTGLWRAPEILKAKRSEVREEQLKNTDVYSYAMTCYEIVTGNLPFKGEVVDARRRPFRGEVRREDVVLGCRPKLPDYLNPDLVKLISGCWHDDPAQRPDFSTICSVLASNPLPNLAPPQSRVGAFFNLLRTTWEGLPS